MPDKCLQFHPLDKPTIHLKVDADASYAGNEDLLSQFGFIILLCDKSIRVHIREYSSPNSTLVVRYNQDGDVRPSLMALT